MWVFCDIGLIFWCWSTAHVFMIDYRYLLVTPDLLSQYGMEDAIAYSCCRVINLLTSFQKQPGELLPCVSAASYKISVVSLSTLSGQHGRDGGGELSPFVR